MMKMAAQKILRLFLVLKVCFKIHTYQILAGPSYTLPHPYTGDP